MKRDNASDASQLRPRQLSSRTWQMLHDLPSKLLIAFVRLYQITLSPWIGRSCRYQPTCSNYMIEAVEKYGFWKGAWRGTCRIARCHPLHAGGYDPP
jgi:putative membrane protein insertion efficiency factor